MKPLLLLYMPIPTSVHTANHSVMPRGSRLRPGLRVLSSNMDNQRTSVVTDTLKS